MVITISPRRLTDGSLVHNLIVPAATLYAVTERDAEELATKIRAAVAAHTNDPCTVCYADEAAQ